MSRRNGAPRDCRGGFPKTLARWIDVDGELLGSLITLRRLGAEGVASVDEVLAIRRVQELRLSWELWSSLTEGDGEDPEALLLGALPLHVVEKARLALWGPRWGFGAGTDLRAVT
jgi:hypothetical protein